MATGAAVDDVGRSADPVAAGLLLERIRAQHPDGGDLDDPRLLAALTAVGAASPYLSRICVTRPGALAVLGDLDQRPVLPSMIDGIAAARVAVAQFKELELLRLAARDLLALDPLEEVVAGLSALGDDILAAACRAADPDADLAIIAMGKLGGRELNYASDIDVVLVGTSDPRPVLQVARAGWRVDLDLRPEGRAGPLVRSLESYAAYWNRWAATWEFQALLKARPVAGDAGLGAAWAAEAGRRVWSRPFGADELREVRDLKRRAEAEVARRGLTDREVKRGRGGIRDVEFAVQLLQMVHGRADPSLRVPGTVGALTALAAGGYVDAEDAGRLADAYRWLRTVEHRLQLRGGQPVHAVPSGRGARTHLARTLGFRDTASQSAVAAFDSELRAHQGAVRVLHERLFFRPLLEAFTAAPAATALDRSAVEDRLAAFGFTDAERTRQAIHALTAGFSRSSRLWQQLLPLVLAWLSEAPNPELGLFGLRALADSPHARDRVNAAVRESAEAARRLCLLLGTGPMFTRGLLRSPDVLRALDFLGDAAVPTPRPPDPSGRRSGGPGRRGAGPGAAAAAPGPGADGWVEVDVTATTARAQRSVGWRAGTASTREGLLAFRRTEELAIAAHDVLGHSDVDRTGRTLTVVAEAVLAAALEAVRPAAPIAVIAMGRLGGRELSYASDLDVLLVSGPGTGGDDDTLAVGQALLQLVNGETPAMRVYTLDTNLRPEGRQGPVVRSLDAYATYYERWAQTWERQALLRGRVVAGDADLGQRFADLAARFVWDRPLGEEDVRAIRRTKARIERERIPAGEDPQFHLKLGRGSLSDIEWTVQLLQLRHGVRATGTVEGIDGLVRAGAVDPEDAAVLTGAYRFCEHTRNRLTLVRGTASDALPATGTHLTTLARSLGTTASELRAEYRRVTRRSRRVVERLFYGRP